METKGNSKSYGFLAVLVVLLFISLNMLITPNDEKYANAVKDRETLLSTIDWETSFNSVAREIENSGNYFTDRVVFELYEGKKEVFMGVTLKEVPDNNSLINYLESIIYSLSKEASWENGMRPPSKQLLDYGEVFDYYNIRVGAYGVNGYETPDKWLVHYRIPKGSHKKIQIR